MAVDDGARRLRLQDVEGDDGVRSPFQRDRDAILYTTAFRRLAGVTQVVTPGEGEIYHNRLTHTLEVAQIARRLAEYLLEKNADLIEAHGGLDPDVVEAAALAHDLGHPPFGHVAEKTLNALLVEKGIGDGYEGNAQSFRIVTSLSIRREGEDRRGLNLTRATLNATLKYPWRQWWVRNRTGEIKQDREKWGAYPSEDAHFRFAREHHVGESRQKCLEAEIMDWADDIAYSVHDTEDFYRAGLIPLDRLVSVPGEADRFIANVFERWGQIGKNRDYDDAKRGRIALAFQSLLATLSLTRPYEATVAQRANLRQFTSSFIGRYIMGTRLGEPGQPSRLTIDERLRDEVEMLKELTWQYVIKGAALAAQQHGFRRIVKKLFEVFAEATLSPKPNRWWVLPRGANDTISSLHRHGAGAIPDAVRFRVAADAIAGMTDRQALLMYQRLMGIASGSILDVIVG